MINSNSIDSNIYTVESMKEIDECILNHVGKNMRSIQNIIHQSNPACPMTKIDYTSIINNLNKSLQNAQEFEKQFICNWLYLK